MISEQDKQAILNGEYGITKDGRKVKFLYRSPTHKFPYLFLIFNQESENTFWFDRDFRTYSDNDTVVGLWNKTFNLKEALQGKPVQLASGDKAYVLKNLTNPMYNNETLVGYGIDSETGKQYVETWNELGEVSLCHNSISRIIGMWV